MPPEYNERPATPPVYEPVAPPAPEPAMTPQVLNPQPPVYQTQPVYSYNSSTIKHARRAAKISSILWIVITLLVVAGLASAWVAAGAPTSVEEAPFLDHLLNSK